MLTTIAMAVAVAVALGGSGDALELDEDLRMVVADVQAPGGGATEKAYENFGAPFDETVSVIGGEPPAGWGLASATQQSAFDGGIVFTAFDADASVLAAGAGDHAAIGVSQVDVGFVVTIPRAFDLAVTVTGEGEGRAVHVRLGGTDGIGLDVTWLDVFGDGVFAASGVMPPGFNVTLFACLEASSSAAAAGESAGAMAISFTTRPAADLDADGDVDGADLGAMLGAWGPCEACAADLDLDGVVGGDDLAWVLAAWTDSDR